MSSVETRSEQTTVKFICEHDVRFGQAVYLVGNQPEIGGWNPFKAQRLTYSSSKESWTGKQVFSAQEPVKLEYKYIVSDYDLEAESKFTWESGPNRQAKLNQSQVSKSHSGEASKPIKLMDRWNTRRAAISFIYPVDITNFELYLYIDQPKGDSSLFGAIPNINSAWRMSPIFSSNNNAVDFSGEWRHKFYVDVFHLSFDYTIGILDTKTNKVLWEREGFRTFCIEPAVLSHSHEQKDHRHELPTRWKKPTAHSTSFDKTSDGTPLEEETTYEVSQKGTYRKIDCQSFKTKLSIQRLLDSYFFGPMIMSQEEVKFLERKHIKVILNLMGSEKMEQLGYDEKMLYQSCQASKIKVLNFPIEEDQKFCQVVPSLMKKIRHILKNYGQLYIQSSNELALGVIVTSFLFGEGNSPFEREFCLESPNSSSFEELSTLIQRVR